MLDKLKDTVPNLDDNDKEKIYEAVNNRVKPKRINLFRKQFAFILIGAIILASIIIPIGINVFSGRDQMPYEKALLPDGSGGETSRPDTDEPGGNIDPIEPDNNNAKTYDYFLSETELIGVAAYKAFDNKESIKLTSLTYSADEILDNNTDNKNENNDVKNNIYSYPFDFVKIHSAYKFSVLVDDIEDTQAKEIIEAKCGLGELEVVVSTFSTFYDDNGIIKLVVSDETLISLRGYNGYYTILENSGKFTLGESYYSFSSHKKLGSDEIVKDFTPPFLGILLRIDSNGNYYINFKTSEIIVGVDTYDYKTEFKQQSLVEEINPEEIYSTEELTEFKTRTVKATVLKIVNNYWIEVETNSNLKVVIIGPYTVGNFADAFNNLAFNVGDTIIVEYAELYAKYDPVMISPSIINLDNA